MLDNSFEGKVLSSDAQNAGTTGTGEQTVKTFSLPANSLCQGSQGLRIKATFSHAANTHGVTYKLYFGSESISSGSDTTSGDIALLELDVVKTGSKTQLVTASGVAAGAVLAPAITRATEDDTAAITIKATVTGGTTGADGACESLQVEFLQSA